MWHEPHAVGDAFKSGRGGLSVHILVLNISIFFALPSLCVGFISLAEDLSSSVVVVVCGKRAAPPPSVSRAVELESCSRAACHHGITVCLSGGMQKDLPSRSAL